MLHQLRAAAAAEETRMESRRYVRDLAAHFTELSGCRIQLNDSGPFRAAYFQIYATDKSVTYHVEKGRHSKYITGRMALKGDPPTCIPQYCINLANAYQEAMANTPCAARIEIRVPLRHASAVLRYTSQELLVHSIVGFNGGLLW